MGGVPLEWAILGNSYYYILHFPKHTITASHMATLNLDSLEHPFLLKGCYCCCWLLAFVIFFSSPPLPQKKAHRAS
jgi:hypothetical protein